MVFLVDKSNFFQKVRISLQLVIFIVVCSTPIYFALFPFDYEEVDRSLDRVSDFLAQKSF